MPDQPRITAAAAWRPSDQTAEASGLTATELEALAAVAHGAEGVMYFQWRKGLGGFEKNHAFCQYGCTRSARASIWRPTSA